MEPNKPTPTGSATPAAATKEPTFMEKLAQHAPSEGNINVFAKDSKFVAKNNVVHCLHGSRYVDLRNIDPDLAELLSDDKNAPFLEKKK